MFQKSSHVRPSDDLEDAQLHTGQLVFFSVAAAAPMSVIAGGVVTVLAITGNVGVPLGLALIALALLIFTVGYNAMSRHITNTGSFAAYLAHGFGPIWGVVGSYVALTTYNAMQISLYGLFGYVAHLAGVEMGLDLPWWTWSFIAMALVFWLGFANVNLNAKVLAILLTLEVVSIVLFDIAAFMNPSGGSIDWTSLTPDALLSPGIGGVFAFAIAAFVGFESSPFYSEETKQPGKSVTRATYWALGITGVLYVVSSFALIVRGGTDNIVALANDPDVSLPFDFMEVDLGETIALLAGVFLLTSVFAGLGSFHNNVARYLYAGGRDGILPHSAALARTGRNGAPIVGSMVQSASAVVIVAVFAIAGADPLDHLFAWLAYIAAIGFLLLMIATSVAVVHYFRSRPEGETKLQTRYAPIAATGVLSAITVVAVVNAGAMLGTTETTAIAYVLPGVVVLAALAGYVNGLRIKHTRPGTYALIGKHGPTQS
jgi:amino acid transporter